MTHTNKHETTCMIPVAFVVKIVKFKIIYSICGIPQGIEYNQLRCLMNKGQQKKKEI